MLVVGSGVLACGPAPPAVSSDDPYGEAKQRLAAKRQELAEGGPVARPPRSPERAERRAVPPPRRKPAREAPRERTDPPKQDPVPRQENPYAAVGDYLREEDPASPPNKVPIPSHLPRRERLMRACYRDTFNVTKMSVVPHMPESWRQFCPCMVDTIFSTGVSASLQEALIENFKDRDEVEASNPEFNRWWHRCRM